MILYHGSDRILKQPTYGSGNPKNDYGLGFYCTEHLDLAKEWACSDMKNGFANKYSLDTDGLTVLDLQSDEFHILNWLAVLLENRTFVLKNGLPTEAREYILQTFLPDYKNFDIIRGYRADDSYFAFTQYFINNTISLSQLRRAMYLGRLGEQIVLKSRNAFSHLTFIDAIEAYNEIYYPRKVAHDREARLAFKMDKDTGNNYVDYFVIDILRTKWNNDDPRLR